MEANFIQKLKKGKGKYNGKLLFKCFNYGDVRHFAAKCPFNKKNKIDEGLYRERGDWKKKLNFRKDHFKKKSFIYKNVSSLDDIFSDDLEEEIGEALFMAFEEETLEEELECDEEEIDGQVNMEEEYIASLDELNAKRKRHKKIVRNIGDANETITCLKVQIEEFRKICEALEVQLTMNIENYNKLEEEVISLRMQLEELDQKINMYHKFKGGTRKLDKLIENKKNLI